MKEGLIKDAYELILKELQTILTILYLLMVGIGMLFNYKKYSQFGINIFEYADVFDFLIAPFEDVQIILVSVLASLIPMGIFWLDSLIKKRLPRIYRVLSFFLSKKSWFNKLKIGAFGFILIYFIFEAALGYGRFMKRLIPLQNPVVITFVDDEVLQGRMIGKTKEVLFLMVEDRVKIIPITSTVKEIELK